MEWRFYFLQNGAERFATCSSCKAALERARALAAEDVLYIEGPAGEKIGKAAILDWRRINPAPGTEVPRVAS
jgi:hypothetical protein